MLHRVLRECCVVWFYGRCPSRSVCLYTRGIASFGTGLATHTPNGSRVIFFNQMVCWRCISKLYSSSISTRKYSWYQPQRSVNCRGVVENFDCTAVVVFSENVILEVARIETKAFLYSTWQSMTLHDGVDWWLWYWWDVIFSILSSPALYSDMCTGTGSVNLVDISRLWTFQYCWTSRWNPIVLSLW